MPDLTAQQRYMRSIKGKAGKKISNAKYAMKVRVIDKSVAKQFLESLSKDKPLYYSLNELWNLYKTWSIACPIKMNEFKEQLAEMNVPIVLCYIEINKKIHRKVYAVGII